MLGLSTACVIATWPFRDAQNNHRTQTPTSHRSSSAGARQQVPLQTDSSLTLICPNTPTFVTSTSPIPICPPQKRTSPHGPTPIPPRTILRHPRILRVLSALLLRLREPARPRFAGAGAGGQGPTRCALARLYRGFLRAVSRLMFLV